jgi:flavin reductase (DIM6/NTAB) family NADH-FMN oxidoreductase RutF
MKMERGAKIKAERYFMTGVSLITSLGTNGQNVMAAEWTMQVSYEPILIAVFIHEDSVTLENIKKTKEFGVNVASEQQTTVVSIAGGYSRKEIDKLAIHDYIQLLKPKKIRPPLIAGCIINAECQLVITKKIGDHTMVVGKVVSMRYDKTKKPLVYHLGRYFRIGPIIEPIRREIGVNQKIFELFHKKAKGKFILKCVGVLVRSRNKILVSNRSGYNSLSIIPHIVAHRGQNHKKELETYLRKIKLNLILTQDLSLKRLILKRGKQAQRINFILFSGKVKNKSTTFSWKSIENDSFLRTLLR